ncbi:hypothetical protein Y1Q_0021961 [Alligator mississippiensis]|uniref:Uncharacterized protein n=1 Tax=Alligator mississippiensis TaxID=8496 RepID=A0A151M421_ALLMI|nr:hypothetical protein Y1Q_0021961 [Alligator mississippiensis]
MSSTRCWTSSVRPRTRPRPRGTPSVIEALEQQQQVVLGLQALELEELENVCQCAWAQATATYNQAQRQEEEEQWWEAEWAAQSQAAAREGLALEELESRIRRGLRRVLD